jgi:hypothetical protein
MLTANKERIDIKEAVRRVFALGVQDPTKSATLRRRFEQDMAARFRKIKGLINENIVMKDVLGIKNQNRQGPSILANQLQPQQFMFMRDQQKVEAFMRWLNEQVNEGILEIAAAPGAPGGQPWTNTYVRSSYQSGLVQGRQNLRSAGLDLAPYDQAGNTVNAAMGMPFHADRLALIYTRTFNQLRGVTDWMSGEMSRQLALGLAEGRGPYDIARRLNNAIELQGGTLGRNWTKGVRGVDRARLIARTEIVQSLNTADERVRSSHAARHGRIYKRRDAQALIGEPNCRCALLPEIEEKALGTETSIPEVAPSGPSIPPVTSFTPAKTTDEAWKYTAKLMEDGEASGYVVTRGSGNFRFSDRSKSHIGKVTKKFRGNTADDLEFINTMNEKLTELADRAKKLGIPSLRGIIGGMTGSNWAAMGDGILRMNWPVMRGFMKVKGDVNIQLHIDAYKKSIKKFEKRLTQPGYTGTGREYMQETIERYKKKIKNLEDRIDTTTTSQWKIGDAPSKRPFNAAEYFEGPDMVQEVLEHEFAHHIHQRIHNTDGKDTSKAL